ncbi:MAG: phosphohistidine phosphatase [Desulfuromonadales bacterium C00003068]|jgi:phosphohistidine phosphatase|nr:MAG: phosphohistidine phosphatase [Desulfuromonadales bacterium C00003068]
MTTENPKKRLTLIRHAKSSWNNPELKDFDRPLNKRGKHDAPLMGNRLAKLDLAIDLLLVSTAKRTRLTAEAIVEQLGIDTEQITFDERIYLASLSELTSLLRAIADSHQNVLLIGHNPGITDLANYLVGGRLENIPTCGVFSVEIQIPSWKQLDRAAAKLVFYDYPKNID